MSVYVQILVMALVTYAVRVIPLTIFRRPVKSRFIRSFLYYVPYATLSVMTFPAILQAGEGWLVGLIAFIAAIITALVRGALPLVALVTCLTAYLSALVF